MAAEKGVGGGGGSFAGGGGGGPAARSGCCTSASGLAAVSSITPSGGGGGLRVPKLRPPKVAGRGRPNPPCHREEALVILQVLVQQDSPTAKKTRSSLLSPFACAWTGKTRGILLDNRLKNALESTFLHRVLLPPMDLYCARLLLHRATHCRRLWVMWWSWMLSKPRHLALLCTFDTFPCMQSLPGLDWRVLGPETRQL